MRGDLTTLAKVKEWLAPGSGTLSSGNDPLLSRLVTSASFFVVNYLGRSTLAATAFDEYLDSGGKNFTLLRQWPVISVQALEFGGVAVSQVATGNPPANGYLLEPPPEGGGQQRISVYPYCFPRGRNTIRTLYTAGYQRTEDTETSTGSNSYTTALMWLQDDGVTIAGVAATPVASSPVAGQYTVASGVYTFAVADEGKPISITYSYAPPDVEQAVIELVGERFRQKDRIGVNSKNLPNGETVSFLVKDMSDHIKTALQSYRRVTPT